jgi:hypothetical protein
MKPYAAPAHGIGSNAVVVVWRANDESLSIAVVLIAGMDELVGAILAWQDQEAS